MGIQLMESWDGCTTLAKLVNSVTASFGTAAIGAFGRNGTNGLRLASTSGSTQQCSIQVAKTLPAALGTGYWPTAFRVSALPASGQGRVIMQLRDAGTVQVDIKLLSDGTLQARRGGSTILGTSSASILSATYYHLEAKLVVGTGTSGAFVLRLNNIEILNLSGINTRQSSNNTFNEIVYCFIDSANNTTGVTCDFDDGVVRDDQFHSDKQVKAFLATGNGDTVDWAVTGAGSAYQAINESNPDDDTTRISTTNIGDVALFTFGSVGTGAVIDAVASRMYASKQDPGSAEVARIIKRGGTIYVGDNRSPSQGSYAYLQQQIDMVDPSTGVTWTPTGFNAIQAGLKRTT